VRWRAAAAASLGTAEIDGRQVVLAKPMTFMNLSGDAVAPLFRKHADGPGDLVVLHDDLDLPVGAVRLKRGGGTGGHNGLRSLKERLGTADFLRIRVGIGRPPAGIDPADYVLTPPAPELRGAFDAAIAGGYLRFLQPDVGKWGGISGCREVASRAVERGLVVCPHWLAGGVGLAASMHLLAAVGGGFAEVDANPNPLREEVFPLQIVDGWATLPDAPGLGVEPDLARLERYVVAI